MLCTWRWGESDAMYLKMGWVGYYLPEGGFSWMLCTWRWVESDAMYLKVGWVGCYVPEGGLSRMLCIFECIFEKKSEQEVPLWTPQTAGRHGKHCRMLCTWRWVELGRIQCTWSWVGSDTMYPKVGWVECYVPEGGLSRMLCTCRWVGSDTMSLDTGKCHHWSHRISTDNRGRNSRPKIIHINNILKLNRFHSV